MSVSRRSPSPAVQHHPLGTEERFHEDQQLIKARNKEIGKQREEYFRENCPFTPRVNNNNNNQSETSFSHHQQHQHHQGDVVERLSHNDTMSRRERLERALKEAEEKKMRGVTFHPEINPVSARTVSAANTAATKSNLGPEAAEMLMVNMSVEQRLLREGRLASERRARMKADLEKQERAMLNVHHHHHHDTSNEQQQQDQQQQPLWKRLQDSDKNAKEQKERLRNFLDHQYPFHPSINQVSAATVSMNNHHAEDEGEENGNDIVSRLHDKSIRERSRSVREREEREFKMQKRQYTFQPKVSLRSAQLAVRRAASQGGGTFVQRQQHSEEAKQQTIKVMREAQKEAEDKLHNNHNSSSAHMDPVELSKHVKRIATTDLQQKEQRLKDLEKKTRAEVCPFQPATTRHSAELVSKKFSNAGDVLQRMALERQMKRQRMEEQQQQQVAKEAEVQKAKEEEDAARLGVMDNSRLHDFLEAQDEHVRRKEARVEELRQRVVQDKMSKCTFRPAVCEKSAAITCDHHHQHYDSGAGCVDSSSVSRRSHTSCASAEYENGRALDEQVRGVDSVRARVALAAKLKAEQAEREAKAFGLRGATPSSSAAPSPARSGYSASAQRSSSNRGGGDTSSVARTSVRLTTTTTTTTTTPDRRQQQARSASASSVPREKIELQQPQQPTTTNSARTMATKPAATNIERPRSAEPRGRGQQQQQQVVVSQQNKGETTQQQQQQQAPPQRRSASAGSRPSQQKSTPVSSSQPGRNISNTSNKSTNAVTTTTTQRSSPMRASQDPDYLAQKERFEQRQRLKKQQEQKQQQRQNQPMASTKRSSTPTTTMQQREEEFYDDDDDDDDPPTEDALANRSPRSHPYVPPPVDAYDDGINNNVRGGGRSHHQPNMMMQTAGLLPPQLLAEYEQDWLQQQHQLQQAVSSSSSGAAAAPPPPTTSAPRMQLVKKRSDGPAAAAAVPSSSLVVSGGGGGGGRYPIADATNFLLNQEKHSPPGVDYKKKSAAFDLALRRHLAADHNNSNSSKQQQATNSRYRPGTTMRV